MTEETYKKLLITAEKLIAKYRVLNMEPEDLLQASLTDILSKPAKAHKIIFVKFMYVVMKNRIITYWSHHPQIKGVFVQTYSISVPNTDDLTYENIIPDPLDIENDVSYAVDFESVTFTTPVKIQYLKEQGFRPKEIAVMLNISGPYVNSIYFRANWHNGTAVFNCIHCKHRIDQAENIFVCPDCSALLYKSMGPTITKKGKIYGVKNPKYYDKPLGQAIGHETKVNNNMYKEDNRVFSKSTSEMAEKSKLARTKNPIQRRRILAKMESYDVAAD